MPCRAKLDFIWLGERTLRAQHIIATRVIGTGDITLCCTEKKSRDRQAIYGLHMFSSLDLNGTPGDPRVE